MADTLAAALWLAERGLHVFDVDHPELPRCVGVRTREHDPAICTERGKHPCGKWSTSATVDREQITAMFAGTTRNIGIACGPSNLLVVDEDVPGDFARYASTVDQEIPSTFTVTTGKGSHFYFPAAQRAEADERGGCAPHLRGEHPRRRRVRRRPRFDARFGGRVHADRHRDSGPDVPAMVGCRAHRQGFGRQRGVHPAGRWQRSLMVARRRDHPPPEPAQLTDRRRWLVPDDGDPSRRRRDRDPGRVASVLPRHLLPRRPGPAGQALHLDSGDGPARRRVRAMGSREASRRAGLGSSMDPAHPASAIKPRPVPWTWTSRIPAGEFTLTPGRGGIGKSTFHVWTVAHLTRGSLPGVHFGTPKPCIIAASEDSWERTIVPRLIAVSADMGLVYRVDVVTETDAEVSISLPRDLKQLETEIVASGAILLSVDPVMSVISNGLDSHKDADVRQALTPLARLADRTGCAVLGNAHFNKSSGSDPLSLVMGSAAFGNVARAALGFARDTEAEDESCVISQVKNNLGRLDLPSLRYRIDTAWIDTDEGQAEVGKLVMLGESDRSVADILSDRGSDDERSATSDAAEWIKAFLEDLPTLTAPATEVLHAGEAAGFAKRTLQRARKRAGVRTCKTGLGGGWSWTLEPRRRHEDAEGAYSREMAPKAPSGAEQTSCAVCGLPLDPVMADLGETTHPTCDPWPDTFDAGTVGAEVNQEFA